MHSDMLKCIVENLISWRNLDYIKGREADKRPLDNHRLSEQKYSL
jgi:hypothetical protein